VRRSQPVLGVETSPPDSGSPSGYRTPIPGLWHTGAGAHPMGGVHGWAGRTTACTVLKSR